MSKLPMLSARDVIHKLERAGFCFKRSRGSHHYFYNAKTNRLTSVPIHGGKDIGRGLLRTIIKEAGLSVEQFLEL